MKLTNGWRRVAYLLPLVSILVLASACGGSTPVSTEAPLPPAYPGPYPGAALPLTQPVISIPGGSKGTDSTVKPVLNSNGWWPGAGDENLTRGEVEIAESGILASQANPQIYALYFSGMLPTPCHKLKVKPTGAVVGQQPFGGGRASGTNDKAGSAINLMRWMNSQNNQRDFRSSKGLALSVYE